MCGISQCRVRTKHKVVYIWCDNRRLLLQQDLPLHYDITTHQHIRGSAPRHINHLALMLVCSNILHNRNNPTYLGSFLQILGKLQEREDPACMGPARTQQSSKVTQNMQHTYTQPHPGMYKAIQTCSTCLKYFMRRALPR